MRIAKPSPAPEEQWLADLEQWLAVPSRGEGHEAAPGLINVSLPLMTLTWITFGLVLIVLYKVAWKPILKGLDTRENSIRKALEEAEKARKELAEVDARGRQMLGEAQAQSETMIREARAAAAETSAAMQAKAREEAAWILTSARREIETATEKARRQLRADSADLAAQLAAKLIGGEMSIEKNRELVERLAKEV